MMDSIWRTAEDRSLECFAALGWLEGRPLLVETARRCQMSYRLVMLTSPRAMGNSDWTGRKTEGGLCADKNRGIVCVCSPGMLSHCYLQTSVACSRQTPGVSRRGYGLVDCSHTFVRLRLVDAGAVTHARRRLLLLVPTCIVLPASRNFTRSFCITQMDSVLSQAFLFSWCAFTATVAWKAQLPAVTHRYSSNGMTTTSSTRCSHAGASICRALTSDIWRTGWPQAVRAPSVGGLQRAPEECCWMVSLVSKPPESRHPFTSFKSTPAPFGSFIFPRLWCYPVVRYRPAGCSPRIFWRSKMPH